MTIISPTEGLILMITFGVIFVAAVWFKTHSENHADGFLVADRNVPLWRGAFSIAVSWVWAPAIFICALQAYTQGLPGIFWFTFPNILCFFVFAPLALRLRDRKPNGYTLPEYIYERFDGDVRAHWAFLVVFFGYQFGAIVINCLAGGTLIHALSGLDINIAILLMSVIALSYSMLSGLKASIFTDVIQMTLVLVIGGIIVPACILQAGGLTAVTSGLGGITGEHPSLFDPWIAFTMGIPMTLGLIAGPIGDQMFFQRAMAVKREDVTRTFIYGGLLFGLVPIVLSLLGFLGVNLANAGSITVSDPQMVGPVVVAHLLPKFALFAFCFMALAGLCSTLDSAFCAISSLGAIDVFKRYRNPNASDRELLRASRAIMLVLAILGSGTALLPPKLLWVFLIYGALASAGLFPTIFSLFWDKVSGAGVFWGVTLSLLVGTPLSIYANIVEDPYLIVASAILSVGIGLIVCVGSVLLSGKKAAEKAV